LSETGGFGINAAVKFFGLLLVIVGALAAYFTFTSSEVLSTYTGFFGFLSIILVLLGLFMMLVKAE